jgi:hypothetical protein
MTVHVKPKNFGKLTAALRAAVSVLNGNELTVVARPPQQARGERIMRRPSAPVFTPRKLSAAEQQKAIDAASKSGKRFAEIES